MTLQLHYVIYLLYVLIKEKVLTHYVSVFFYEIICLTIDLYRLGVW